MAGPFPIRYGPWEWNFRDVLLPNQSMQRSAIIAIALAALLVHPGRPTALEGGPTDHIRRRGIDGDRSEPNRRGPDSDRQPRRSAENERKLTQEELERKQQTRQLTILAPPRCGTRHPGRFRTELLNLKSTDPTFTVEVWGNQSVYFTGDSIYYYLRSSRTAYVTLFWIGPEGSVFIPFINVKVEANRDHRIDPRNLIVEPVGAERWRVIATLQPHTLPCGEYGNFSAALRRIQQGKWAGGIWDVESRVRGRRRRGRLHW